MTQTVFDVIQRWRNECAVLEQRIIDLQTGELGRYLPLVQRQSAINDLNETIRQLQALISEFRHYGDLQLAFKAADPNARKPIVRLRFSKHQPLMAALDDNYH